MYHNNLLVCCLIILSSPITWADETILVDLKSPQGPLTRISRQDSSRGRGGAVASGVFDLRDAQSYATVRRASRCEKTSLDAAHPRPQQDAGEICGLPHVERQLQETGRQTHPKAEVTLISESFEGSWPMAPWIVNHREGSADVDWARTDYRASEGEHSIWCAGRGSDAPGAGGLVPAETASWTIVGPFDLSEAALGTLSFDLWLRTETFHDPFMWLASTDGENFAGAARSTDTNGWKSISVDLTEWPNLGDITGEDLVWFAFAYTSDHSGQFEGAYIDNVVLTADSGIQATISHTYTSDDDFNEGSSLGLTVAGGEMELSETWTAYPYIWIANTETGTVSKVSTDLETMGRERGRYRTGPERELKPSTIAVDLDGNCWVTNRAAGTLVKIALEDHDDCVDRNNNGVIDTSSDDNEDGSITEDELLAWGEDECVIFEIVLVDGDERSYTPGEEHDTYADTDLRAITVDADNHLWAGTRDSMKFFKIDTNSAALSAPIDVSENATKPFDAVIDRNGILWSSLWPDTSLLRIDPTSLVVETIDLEHGSRAIVVNNQHQLFVTGYEDEQVSRVNTSTSEVDDTFTAIWQTSGMAVADYLDLWIAAPGPGAVQRFSTSGLLRATMLVANGPTGVSIDANRLVWITGGINENIVVIDPNTNFPSLNFVLVDAGIHDSIGDMTGISARNLTVHHGSWQTVFDSELENTPWGTISWNGDEPEGSAIKIDARSSHDQITWSQWERTTSGESLSATPAGRYLNIKVALQNFSSETSPKLEDITLESMFLIDPPLAEFSWTPENPSIGETVTFSDESTNGPSSWSWAFGDGASSNQANPTHVYTEVGTFTVNLEVNNEAGTDAESKTISISDTDISQSGPRHPRRRVTTDPSP